MIGKGEMEYPFAEVLDRYTILCLKQHFGCDVESELEEFGRVVAKEFGSLWPLVWAAMTIARCNALQWVLESQVSPELPAEVVAEAAWQIRRSNVERVRAKNEIARLVGGVVDRRIMYPGAEEE